jgi:hypothetical protein
MQSLENSSHEDLNDREALSEIRNRSHLRKHTVYINGKQKVAFLEKIGAGKVS